MNKKVFLSHTHKEKDLAILIKETIENEFSGFVEVFVSSDGQSIKTGEQIIDNIERSLLECDAALYLISPVSSEKRWINFELGAIWMKNLKHKKDNEATILAVPMCHSGMTSSNLPSPLSKLSAINLNSTSDIERFMQNLQSALGAKGTLRTDFHALTEKIISFEQVNMEGRKIQDIFRAIDVPHKTINQMIDHAKNNPATDKITLDMGFKENYQIEEINHAIRNSGISNDLIKTQTGGFISETTQSGNKTGSEMEIHIKNKIIVDYADLLNAL